VRRYSEDFASFFAVASSKWSALREASGGPNELEADAVETIRPLDQRTDILADMETRAILPDHYLLLVAPAPATLPAPMIRLRTP
jgi:hypothetical protein